MTNTKILLPLCAMGIVLLNGCVSSGKFHELEASDTKNRQDLAVTSARVSELEGKLGIASTEKNRLEGSVAEMKAALEDAQKRKIETEKRLSEFRELTSKFKKLVDAGKLSVKVVKGRMVIGLSTDILFSSGSAKLSAPGKNSVKEVTQLLAGLEGRKYQIEGHSDNVPIKSNVFPSNWELASARAISVLNTMLEAGMPAERVSAASFGDTQPVGDNTTPEGRTANRRIAIVIVPDLSQLPGFEELNRISADAPAAAGPTK